MHDAGAGRELFLLNINRKEEFLRLFHTICSFQPAPVSVVRQWAGSVSESQGKERSFCIKEVCSSAHYCAGKEKDDELVE